MTKLARCITGVLFILLVVCPNAFGQGRTGTLQMLGVPVDVQAGTYDAGSGVFTADVREIPEAMIEVAFEDMRIQGKQLEWRTKDEHLTFTQSVSLWREDLELEANWLEYDSATKILTAKGEVKVKTEDAVVRAEQLVYNEETDEALFTENVVVEFSDGTVSGDRFLLRVEQKVMQFFGPFQGSFQSSSN
ncbi:MAG TPA: hypothetical protein GX008_11365 [Firmicutes bacterium]|jgi:lipopolysaccharide assembly outer membrane protein LptD (OstA)|nr:MAG: hypothetical protein AA931_00255 [Peptococcaceae bacterium 1109]HHT74297.1 hypothetical protein [Bacillota bacterium]